MDTKYFHFTIGPVQGFVSQARRTRDFWAGSFILSWLAGVAMQSVIAQENNGRKAIQFPTPNDDFMDCLEGKKVEKAPKQGSIPNRFKAEVTDNFKPENVINDVKTAWKALADEIWKNYLEEHCRKHLETRAIWNEQINNFWEISWVLTGNENKDDSDLLDRRKNIRSHFMPEQQGVKCSMMGQWQELSGKFPVNEDFWKGLKIPNSELREGEHLCAIAFIKRRFVHCFEKIDKPMNNWTLKGWELPKNVPSVAYMAAVHWMEKVIYEESKETIESLMQAANWAHIKHDEWNTHIKCLEDACKEKKIDKKFIALDGSVFFPSALTNKNIYDQKYAHVMLEQLNKLKKVKEPPSPFYAVLMMDGDSLGSKMSNPDNQKPISDALNNFTKEVPKLVYRNNGFLIYAGGDDVLAILPLEDALQCAVELHSHYKNCFKGSKNDDIKNSTISAAIEFVHIKEPLTMILKDAHKLLDEIAKEKCGRDSIAVRVWKGSGKAVEWAMPFDCALKKDKFEIERIANEFRDKKNEQKEADFSSKFFYKIREHFNILNPQEGNEDAIVDNGMAIQLLAADYLNSGINRNKPDKDKINLQQAMGKIKPLLEQCRPIERDAEKPKEDWKVSPQLEVDGALLVRFLAKKGLE